MGWRVAKGEGCEWGAGYEKERVGREGGWRVGRDGWEVSSRDEWNWVEGSSWEEGDGVYGGGRSTVRWGR